MYLQGEADGEPDMYYFNFNGASGQFYFDDANNPVFQPTSDYKIEVLKNTSEGFYKWIITSPDGTKYYFGQGEDESGNIESEIRAEKTHPFKEKTGGVFHSAYSSWLLTKIESADGTDIIRFHYSSEKYAYHNFAPTMEGYYYNNSYVKNNIDGWRLSKISFDNGSIVFTPGNLREDLCAYNILSGEESANTEARCLSEIQIKDKSDNCFKKYSLTQTYFNNTSDPSYYLQLPTVNTDKKRLKLDQVQELNCATGSSKPPYVFSYYDESSVPRRLSYAKDHWGYYNGKTSNTILNPIDGSRESVYPAMRAGCLSKIQYPTGGSTTFKYEANNVYRVYTSDEPSQSLYTSLSSAGVTPVYNTVNFDDDEYYIIFSCYAAGDATATLTIGEGTGSITRTLGNGETITETASLNGNIQLAAYTSESWATGTMEIYKLVTNSYSGNFAVGGLRIDSIIQSTSSSPGNNDDIITSYDYNHNGISSGVLYGRPIYKSLVRNDFDAEYGFYREASSRDILTNCPTGCDCSSNDQNVLTSINSIFPMDHSNGYHIGYEYVTVSQSNGSKSLYQYNIATDKEALMFDPIAIVELEDKICDMDVLNYPPAPLEYVPGRGDLIGEYHYAGLDLVKEVRYDNIYSFLTDSTPSLICQVSPVPKTTFYYLKTAKLNSKSIITKTYDDDINDFVEVEEHYFYNSDKHNQVTEHTKTGNNGIYKSKYFYPLDYTSGCEINSSSLTTYENALNTCASLYPYDNYDFSTGDWYYERIDYDGCVSTARVDYAIDRISDQSAAESCLNALYSSADDSKKSIISLMSSNKIIPVEISQWKDDSFLGSSFNAYEDYGTTRTSGLIYPHDVFLFQTSTPLSSSNFTNSSISGSSISRDSDYSSTSESSFIFENGRIAEVEEKNGLIISYLWSINNSLPVVKAENIDFNTLKSAVESAAGSSDLETYWQSLSNVSYNNSTWNNFNTNLRSNSNLEGAMIYTYTYEPLVGMTSETGPDGRTIYYDYDGFGRLQFIRNHLGEIIKKHEYHYANQ